MNRSAKILGFFLLLIYFTYAFRIIFPLIDYTLNFTYIVNELCEQKDVKENRCKGKCHLSKEIKNQVDHSNDENNFVIKNGKTIVLKDKNITIFKFDKTFTDGCRNHKEIANQLSQLFKNLIHE